MGLLSEARTAGRLNVLALLNQNLQRQTPYFLGAALQPLPCAAALLLWATLCALR